VVAVEVVASTSVVEGHCSIGGGVSDIGFVGCRFSSTSSSSDSS
jgi:hypothetical protein